MRSAAAARVLHPGGRFAVSDVIADPDMDDATRADMSQVHREQRIAAGPTDVTVQEIHRVHAAASSAIVRAARARSD